MFIWARLGKGLVYRRTAPTNPTHHTHTFQASTIGSPQIEAPPRFLRFHQPAQSKKIFSDQIQAGNVVPSCVCLPRFLTIPESRYRGGLADWCDAKDLIIRSCMQHPKWESGNSHVVQIFVAQLLCSWRSVNLTKSYFLYSNYSCKSAPLKLETCEQFCEQIHPINFDVWYCGEKYKNKLRCGKG